MIFRLLALLVLPLLTWFLVKSVSRRFALTPRQQHILFLIAAGLLVVAALIATGRLPAQFILAPLGAAFAFLLRFLPALLRLLPIWQLLRGRAASAQTRNQGQTSTIRTTWLTMALDHDSGHVDGQVVKGTFTGAALSGMSLDDLLALYAECNSDADSAQVLEAWLDREHPRWREQVERSGFHDQVADEPLMSRELALEILGLDEPVTRQQVSDAHRKLMRKLHPDRGGSDYLAKKINAAKDFLLKETD